MDQIERHLLLIALFLDAREPIAFDRLCELAPSIYGALPSPAGLRQFDRDRSALAEVGLDVIYQPAQPGDPWERGGYRLTEPSRRPLPELSFQAREDLLRAGRHALEEGLCPGRRDLAHALRKIAWPLRKIAPLPRVNAADKALLKRLEALWTALIARKRLDLLYPGAAGAPFRWRAVDPWGLALREGSWLLVGFCHLRGAERTFRVSRMRAVEVNTTSPREPDFDVPAAFDLARSSPDRPWSLPLHPPIDVILELPAELAESSEQLFPGGLSLGHRGARQRLLVRATHLDRLLSHAFALGAAVKLVGPSAAAERARALLSQIEHAHASPSRRLPKTALSSASTALAGEEVGP